MLRNPKHEAFARELAANEPIYGDRTGALLAAMQVAGYKPAPANGRKLRQRKDVGERILQLRAAHADFVCADIGRIVQEQSYIAFATMADFFEVKDEKLVMKDLTTLPRSLTCCIKEIGFDKEGRPRIKLHDKLAALAALQSYREQGPLPKEPKGRGKETEQQPPPGQSQWGDVLDHGTVQ